MPQSSYVFSLSAESTSKNIMKISINRQPEDVLQLDKAVDDMK